MSGKWIALAMIVVGISIISYAASQAGEGAYGLDRLPLTILLFAVGGVLVFVRLFMAL